MKILIITNNTNIQLNPSIAYLFGAAKDLSQNNSAVCDVLVVGYNTTEFCKQITTFGIVHQILQLDDTLLENILPENIAPQIADIIKTYSHVLINADSFGKNLLPRIAGILEIGQISEITKIISPNIFQRFTYASNILTEVESLESIKLLSVRAHNFTKAQPTDNLAPIVPLKYIQNTSNKVKFISQRIIDKSFNLTSADVVVSGGISLGSQSNFDGHIRTLAHNLQAAVGATRDAVEAGYAPNDCQVGQTGTIVAPKLYLAVGISGAIQHIAGIKDSKVVIAINTDESATIFEHADYGIIGDLFELVPKLIKLTS